MPDEFPLVTIITPAYNYADLLPETMNSILAQDYANFEYIVLDDGSTDNTREVLEQYGDRIRWESHENMGEPRTVNKGFQMAKGEYLIVVNSDDPVMPGFVSTAVAFMEAHPDVLAAYPRWLWIDENGEVIQEFPTYEFDYQTMLLAHHCYPGPGAIIRRRAIELEHGRDVTFRWLSDYDFWLRVGLHGPIARIPAVLALSRKHWRARTYADVSPALVQEHIRTVENFYERPDLPPEIVALKNQAISYTYYVAGAVMMPLDWSTARQYFIHSLRISLVCRVRHPNGDTRSWMLMLRVILLPRAVNKFLKQVWLPLKKILRPNQRQ